MGRVIGVENQRGGSPVTSRVSRVAIKSQRSVAVDDDGGGGRTAAMKYAARIHCVGDISRVIVRLSRYDWSPGKGRTTAVNTRIIKRTNYRACARTIPKSYTDGVGNHLLRARFPRRIFREIETATADGVDFFRSTRYAHGSLTYESNERGRHSRLLIENPSNWSENLALSFTIKNEPRFSLSYYRSWITGSLDLLIVLGISCLSNCHLYLYTFFHPTR